MLPLLLLLVLLPPDPTKDCKDKFCPNEDDDVFILDILPRLSILKLPSAEAEEPCAWAGRGSNDDGSNTIRTSEENNNIDKGVKVEGTVNLCLSGLPYLNI